MVDISTTVISSELRRRVARRLLPPLFIMFVLSFLDRTNVSLVKDQLHASAGISAAVFGLGAGVFFIGYAVFGVPSNLVLHRIGARRWLAGMMFVWGVLSALMALTSDPTSFYLLRFALGIAEAGFFPGVILYITYWFPYRERGKATGVFQSAVAVASIVGNPVGGYLLGMHGLLGLDGWQWMFILEGVPTAVFALAVPWLLTDRPEQARWLTAEQRTELATAIKADEPPADRQPRRGIGAVLRDSRVLRLIYVYFAIQLGVYGVTFWLPALVKRIGGLTDVQVGLLAALPWVFALAGVLVLPWLSDRTGNRRGPLLIALACTLLGLLGGAALPPWPGLFALCVAAFGFLGAQPVFWTVPPTILAGVQVAATIPLISGIGNLGGFVGPSIMGFTEEATGSGAGGLYLIAAVVLLGGLFAATFRWVGRRT
ncbi:MFS transporter [Pseudonocardia eucalypti]|uniref:MFS transporter n=1 Tax=Pseudonocardia eucalypti TaxID=648755 RepID=A0ABP9Q6X1_9PSEU